MTEFLLLRHGETLWNLAGRLQGWQDSPLSAAGATQAEALAARLAAERVERLVASDLGRARATAAPIAARLALATTADPGLRERCYGVLEGRTWDEIRSTYPEAYARLLARDANYVIPGGESAAQFRDRVVASLERLARENPGAAVAVVTHGGVLGVVHRRVRAIPLEAPRTFSVPNGGVNRVRIAGGRWSIVAWAETDHLPEPALDDE